MIFESGKHYRFIQTDCAGDHIPGLSSKSGNIVKYVKPLRKGCHLVTCPLGSNFRVFDDELHYIVPKAVSEANMQKFYPGDEIICVSEDTELPCKLIEFGEVYISEGMHASNALVHVQGKGMWLAQRFELAGRRRRHL